MNRRMKVKSWRQAGSLRMLANVCAVNVDLEQGAVGLVFWWADEMFFLLTSISERHSEIRVCMTVPDACEFCHLEGDIVSLHLT